MELQNKRIIFLGDSITHIGLASSNQNIYHQIIARKHGLEKAINCGIGGTRIAKQNYPSTHINDVYFGLRLELMPREADAVVVFGGTNDFGHGDAKLGDIDSTDICTFYGAVNTLITDLENNYPNSKIIFMTPLMRSNQNVPNYNGYILAQYAEAIINATKIHNIPVIDLYGCGLFDPNDTNLFPDGLHPNDKGNEILADYVAQKLLEI